MSSKTRKLIWSVPLMATLAVVGALAVFVALGLPNPQQAEAVSRNSKSIATQMVYFDTSALGMLDVRGAFDTEIGESIIYAAESGAKAIATVAAASTGMVTITPTGLGEADITVTATDATDNSSDTATATVQGGGNRRQNGVPDPLVTLYVSTAASDSSQGTEHSCWLVRQPQPASARCIRQHRVTRQS